MAGSVKSAPQSPDRNPQAPAGNEDSSPGRKSPFSFALLWFAVPVALLVLAELLTK